MPVVDLPSSGTYKLTATALAQGLYYNTPLNVGVNPIQLPNVIAQFSNTSTQYSQVNLQNFSGQGSGDFVVTANNGTDTTYYVATGINGSQYNQPAFNVTWPNDGYIYVQGAASGGQVGGNLAIGTATTGKDIVFFLGGTTLNDVVARFNITTGFTLRGEPLTFADGTSQNTAVQQTFVQASFDTANSASGNTVALQTYSTLANGNVIALQSQVLTLNANVIAVNTFTQAAYAQANNASGNTVAIQTYSTLANGNVIALQSQVLTLNANVIAVNTFTQAAFNRANNALANTSGIFAGNLQLTGNLIAQGIQSTSGPITTGNLIVSGTSTLIGNVTMNANTYMTGTVTVNSTMVLANSLFSATEAAFTITAAGSSQTPTQAGTLMQLTSKANTPARVLVDSFGTSNTAYPIIAGRNARGTVTSPTATQNNDILLRIAGNSYGTTGYAPFGDARIDFVATENHSDTNRGSRIRFWNTPIGSNVVNEIASFNADSVYFTGTVGPQKGFIYTPTVLPGAQTAFTIDFSTTSLIKASLAADLTITLSNYVHGKVVEVWLTNTGGVTRTITHGCTATNSSENSATFAMPGTSSAYLRYFSIDGDNANTFVAIQHA
jgi:hypothetical protein